MEGSGARVLWPAAAGRRCAAVRVRGEQRPGERKRAAGSAQRAAGRRQRYPSRKTAQAQTGPSIATKNGSKRRRRGGQGRTGQGREAAQSKKEMPGRSRDQRGLRVSKLASAEEDGTKSHRRMQVHCALCTGLGAGLAGWTLGCWSPCRPAPHQSSRSRQGRRGGGGRAGVQVDSASRAQGSGAGE